MRYVDADAVNKVFIDELAKIPSVLLDERIEWTAAREAIIRCARGVAAIPTENEVGHGKWKIKWHSFFRENLPYCSVCYKFAPLKTAFCPNCGARMDGKGE